MDNPLRLTTNELFQHIKKSGTRHWVARDTVAAGEWFCITAHIIKTPPPEFKLNRTSHGIDHESTLGDLLMLAVKSPPHYSCSQIWMHDGIAVFIIDCVLVGDGHQASRVVP